MTKGIILALGVLVLSGCGEKGPEYTTSYTCFTQMGMLRDEASNVRRGQLGYEFSVNEGELLVDVPAANCIRVSEKKVEE